MTDRWATFDCYGTLIDWHGGLRAGIASLWPDADVGALHRRYLDIEASLQAGVGTPYRQVLTDGLVRLAAEAGLELPPGSETTLADALPSWPAFPEVSAALAELRARGWKLAILSNTDPDYLEASLEHIGVPVDLRVVASKIGSYKPAPGHWEAFFRETGVPRSRHVHVAASLFHDAEPCALLGIPCVWIDREAEVATVPVAARLTDLTLLPETLDTIVPA
ncbi:MAG: HAD-IA family hydrolase [Chloroflexi bacterium]|nr:HAD-IA family hydrolase [Chloroflexota bacterium]